MFRAELHLAINSDEPAEDCAAHARFRVPWWNDATISDLLTDTQLRTYLWAYPAGFDWFANLADTAPETRKRVLHAAYRDPLTPEDLQALWPDGPAIGAPGSRETESVPGHASQDCC